MKKDTPPTQSSETDLLYRSIFDAANDGLIIIDLETSRVVEGNPGACRMHGYTREEFIGLQLTAFLHPSNQYEFSEYIRTFQLDSAFDIRALHVYQDGSTFYAEWRGTVFTYQGRTCLLGIVRDVSKRIEAEQSLRQVVETHTHEQATLLEISHTLASTLELKPGLILDQLQEIIEYTHGGLFVLEGSKLISLALRGTPQLERSAPFLIQIPGSDTLDVLFNEHQPIRIANIRSDQPQAQFLGSLFVGKASLLLEGMQSWMWVPLAVKDRIIGGVGFAEASKNYFTAHHANLALSAANQAAITMINTELYGQAQELAVLEERQSLARNLHDAINQSLFSAGLIAEVLPRLWERDQGEARIALEDLRRLTRGAQAEMRALLAELRPSTLTDADLGDLLRLLGNAHSGRTNTPVIVTVLENIILPAQVQITFYRVCQEALFNVAKHSKARQVEINLKKEGAIIEMSILDDGQGFNLDQIISGHYGLNMMRERAEAVGAKLSITSQPGNGTELMLQWVKTPSKED